MAMAVAQPLPTVTVYLWVPAPGVTHSSRPVPTSAPVSSVHVAIAISGLGPMVAVRHTVSPSHTFVGPSTLTSRLSGTSFT